MELSQPTKYFRTAINGFDKKDVTEYIAKIHTAHRKENDKHRQIAAALQLEKAQLQQECTYLRQQLDHFANQPPQIVEVEKIVTVPVERVVEKRVEVPKFVEKFVPYAAEPDEDMLVHLRQQGQDIERLNLQIDAHIAVRGQLESTVQELEAALERANASKKKYKDEARRAINAVQNIQSKASIGPDAESMAYLRAEAIEQEARMNAEQIRAGLQDLLREAKEVLRGVQAQTAQETAQINTRATQFLEVLGNMPDMLDDVLKQVERDAQP